jgi:hypothetical protein
MNTRRYPRSTLEAFGCDARTACAIERPRNPDGVVAWLGIAIIVCLLAAVSLGVI